ncbi:hypothetical protein ACIBCT_35080 [Streptosporangium sp. NPDC050855]|uniref:hypothetical protein n=1 Tax=Streptosporangium sp. NPDC050855 TaxID=3366194 RepID=UPI0037A8B7B8
MAKKTKKVPRRGVSGNPARRAQAEQLLAEDTLICEICRAPLDWKTANGITSFSHPAGIKLEFEHRPMPTTGKPTPATTVCDFCGETGISASFVTAKQIVVPDVDAQGNPTGTGNGYDKRWVACARCTPLVERGNLAALLDRAAHMLGARHDLGEAQRARLRRDAKRLQEAFFEAEPTGPFPA